MIAYRLKKMLAEGKTLIGKGVLSHNPALIEILGLTGFDFVLIDTEHSPLGVDIDMAGLIRAANAVDLPVIVRVKGVVDHMIQGALELGAEGVLIPHLGSRADAEAAVRAAKFPPLGGRGFAGSVRAARFGTGNMDPDAYIAASNRDTLVIGLAEDRAFFEDVEGILSVPGLDMVYFGSVDLAVSYGLSPRNPMGHPQVQADFAKLKEAADRHGIPLLGRAATHGMEELEQFVARGYRTIIVGSDITAFRDLCAEYIAGAHKILGPDRR